MKTKTIEERAKKYVWKEWTPECHFIAEESYIAGAKEQKVIDIDKACEWIKERAKEYGSKKGDISLSPIYNEALASIYEEAYIAGATEQKAIDMDRACEWLKGVQCVVHQQIAYGFAEEFRKAMEE